MLEMVICRLLVSDFLVLMVAGEVKIISELAHYLLNNIAYCGWFSIYLCQALWLFSKIHNLSSRTIQFELEFYCI
jgi:hypothetical protein